MFVIRVVTVGRRIRARFSILFSLFGHVSLKGDEFRKLASGSLWTTLTSKSVLVCLKCV